MKCGVAKSEVPVAASSVDSSQRNSTVTFVQNSSTMEDGYNVDVILLYAINQALVSLEDFSQVLSLEFRYDFSRKRKLR